MWITKATADYLMMLFEKYETLQECLGNVHYDPDAAAVISLYMGRGYKYSSQVIT